MTASADTRREITTTIRMLAADAIEKANSGHPGAPMGLADIAHVLWDEFFDSIHRIQIGMVATDLFCLVVMHRCSNMPCFICGAMM